MMEKEFERIGVRYFPSSANYMLLKSSYDLFTLLKEKMILIRDCEQLRRTEKGILQGGRERQGGEPSADPRTGRDLRAERNTECRKDGRTVAKVIMIQGTMSNAGKSILVGGLCRVFRQDGYKTAPFKSQNMALNSYITKEGLEMGRAQVMQAEAAGIEPCVEMNPILLKPTNDTGSQVIVNGEVTGVMSAAEYYRHKKEYIPAILEAYHKLEEQYDIIVIEGAGSPAEINLKDDDIVNMGMAKLVDAPVLLVGDIDRGGVFAQIVGTLELLDQEERDRIKGTVINKFRGDKEILRPGLDMLEGKNKGAGAGGDSLFLPGH